MSKSTVVAINWTESPTAVVKIPTKCPSCGDTLTLFLDADQYRLWKLPRSQGGLLIQDAFPMLSNADRERLMTGTCSSCWDKMWESEDDD